MNEMTWTVDRRHAENINERDSKSDREKKQWTNGRVLYCTKQCKKMHEHFYGHVIKIVQFTFFMYKYVFVCIFGWMTSGGRIMCVVHMLNIYFFFLSINDILKWCVSFGVFNSFRFCFACVHSLRLPQILTKVTVCLSFFTSLTQENNNVFGYFCIPWLMVAECSVSSLLPKIKICRYLTGVPIHIIYIYTNESSSLIFILNKKSFYIH